MTRKPVSRRRFLAGATAAAGLALVPGACTDADPVDPTDVADPLSGPSAGTDHGLATAIARIEKLTAEAYVSLRSLTTAGKLGAAVPPALATLLVTAAGHHDRAVIEWNKVLDGAGRPSVTSPDEALRPAVDAATAKVADVLDAARLALRLEDLTSQTYQKAIPRLRGPDLVTLAARLNVVGQQRQAVLRYMLGLPPAGSGTGKETKDFAPADPKASLITG